MNADRLLALYEKVADAPDAIAKLRRFVLDAAIKGSLTGDCENWTAMPIERCLEPLEDGKFIHQGWSPRCETFPVSAPEKWGVLKTTAIQDGFFLEHENKQLPSHLSPKEKLEIIAGDILLTCAGPRARCGIACTVPITRPRLLMSGKMYRFRADRSQILTDYLGLFLRSSMSWLAIDAMKTGSSESGLNLTKDRFRKFEVHFGSLNEQRTILAKVSELIALLDQLEAARAAREATRDRLTAASLARLTAPAPDAAEPEPATGAAGLTDGETTPAADPFPGHARFALDALPALTARPDQIKQMRQTILNLAVRGKLVAQDAGDEPAPELLKRIAAEKARLNPARKRGTTSAASENELAVALPQTWSFARLGDISLQLHYGYTASASNIDKNIRLLRITDIQNDHVDWESVPGCEIDEKTFPKYSLEPGDLLIARTGGTIGKTFLVSDVPVKSVFASYLIRVQPAHSLHAPYIKLFCGSEVYWDQLREGSRGGGQPNVNGKTLGLMSVPLPPLAEQRRIVAKVDELIALLDQLEAALTAADTTRQHLLDALLHEALGGTVATKQQAAE